MSEPMSDEERAARIRRLQERRGTATGTGDGKAGGRRPRRHGFKSRIALTALALGSFVSIGGAMAVQAQQGSTTASVASAPNASTTSATTGSTTASTAATTATTATTATRTATPSSTKSTTATAVTSTKGS